MTSEKNTTPATLATVKHGGCVQLPASERARLEAWADDRGLDTTKYSDNGMEDSYDDLNTGQFWDAWLSAISSQPSTGGQGAARYERLFLSAVEMLTKISLRLGLEPNSDGVEPMLAAIDALAARQPVGQIVGWQHCGENHEHMVISDRTKQALKEGETERGIQKIESAYSIPLVRQPVGELTDTEIDARLNTLYRAMVASGQHNGGMSGVAWDRAVYRMASSQPAQAVDPADPWRGLYSPELMPKLDGVNLYHAAHPDLPSWPKDEDDERGIGPLITAQGFAMTVVFGEYPDDDGEEVDYCAWLASWTPNAPAGLGWRLVCIQDTEDGPAAFYVRPLALIDSQVVGNG